MKLSELGCGESRLETIVSYILIGGVTLSLVLEVVGIIEFYRTYGSLNILTQDRSVFIQGKNFFTFLAGVFGRAKAENSSLFMMTLGMASLILTPFVMAVVALCYFLWSRKLKYVLVTAIVVVIISVSLALH